jgi:hypothetical protein
MAILRALFGASAENRDRVTGRVYFPHWRFYQALTQFRIYTTATSKR